MLILCDDKDIAELLLSYPLIQPAACINTGTNHKPWTRARGTFTSIHWDSLGSREHLEENLMVLTGHGWVSDFDLNNSWTHSNLRALTAWEVSCKLRLSAMEFL